MYLVTVSISGKKREDKNKEHYMSIEFWSMSRESDTGTSQTPCKLHSPDLVPSEMACFESSPGKSKRVAVWISREEMVDFLFILHKFAHSLAILPKMSWMKEFMTEKKRRGMGKRDTIRDQHLKRLIHLRKRWAQRRFRDEGSTGTSVQRRRRSSRQAVIALTHYSYSSWKLQCLDELVSRLYRCK